MKTLYVLLATLIISGCSLTFKDVEIKDAETGTTEEADESGKGE